MLLSVSEARARLLGSLSLGEVEIVPLPEALGRVLAESVVSEVDLPPFSNASMDGFAVRAVDVAGASEAHAVTLDVVDDIPAGHVPRRAISSGETVRIMTGAPLPPGADAVVPVESSSFTTRQAGAIAPEQVEIYHEAAIGEHIRPEGQDMQAGDLVLEAGRRIRPQDLGMMATLGVAEVLVTRRPRVALLATGDELIPVEAPLRPGKIRESNTFTLAAQVAQAGGEAVKLGVVPDERQAVRERLEKAADAEVDLIVSSAGVSVGAFDFVREVVEEYGELSFWRVNMRPGKPLAFGHFRQVPFVGLPGNPVSAFVGFEVFLRPALHTLEGDKMWKRRRMQARLIDDVDSDGRESYLRAVVEETENGREARLTGHQGSGNLFSLVQANALIVIPAGVKHMPGGTMVEVWPIA